MKLLLDTNAYTALFRGDEAVAARVRSASQILISTVVAGELLFGFRNGSRYGANRKELEDFLASPYVVLLPVTLETADRFGRIAASLRRRVRRCRPTTSGSRRTRWSQERTFFRSINISLKWTKSRGFARRPPPDRESGAVGKPDMRQTIEAIYTDGVLKPTEELSLRDKQRVRVTVEIVYESKTDREAAVARLKAGIASMRFFSEGPLPTREELHDRH